MIYSTALTTDTHNEAAQHLLRSDEQEDLCFALWYPSSGKTRTTGLVHTLILPREGDRNVHGNVSFNSQYVERALAQAVEQSSGLCLMHSHLSPGWQGMSSDDVAAEQNLAAKIKGGTGYPLMGMTLGSDRAWSSRFWEKVAPRAYERKWCQTVRVVGDMMQLTYNDILLPPAKFKPELQRTISAWGSKAQANLARLKIGIVGTGSVGSLIAEALARMGLQSILLLDFDAIERVNLDRLYFATQSDVGKSKVRVLASRLVNSATADNFNVSPQEYSIVEEEGFRAALDCDILFSCVDRSWPRSVLNFIAYTHLIPVVDGGILAKALINNAGLEEARWRAHISAPTRPCLEL